MGNPLSDGVRQYTWEHGRELATITKDGATWTNTYNQDGMRIRRTNGTVTYGYVYNGSQLSQMTVDGNTLNFSYDANGIPMSVSYNGTTYYYATNLQGDVTAILNASGSPVVSYTYDAWGKPLTVTGSLATTLGTHNPLRYRGYVYDTETELYYIANRYYNPEIGRWINVDGYIITPTNSLLATNTFAYCENNPVGKFDPSGNFGIAAALGGGIALWKVAVVLVGTVTALVVADTLVKNPPKFQTGSDFKAKSTPKVESKVVATKKPRRDPVHHIVAQADRRAAESREILRDVGIEPSTDPQNLVILPQSYHVSLHTTAYHNYVTERLRQVAGDRKGVEVTLALLRAEILARSAAGIRWD